ncbi:NlpC/P60 family protein [Pseudalkalibacillus caeni]|uniref:C40 family peptidase n=1 Tax=Exobacillus caeni TaxID=2574798 RepID=UPI003CCC6FF9
MTKTLAVNVKVATLWTKPQNPPREIDKPALENPVRLEEWLDSLHYEPRLQLCNDNMVQSQLLYGEKVLFLDEEDGWSKVIALSQPSSKDERGYPGWMPSTQLKEIEEYTKLSDDKTVEVVKPVTNLFEDKDKKGLEVSFQTRLPFIEEEEEWIQVGTPTGYQWLKKEDVMVREKNTPKGDGEQVIKAAEKFVGLPYLWGGMSSFGYDCSGFSYNMTRSIGYTIPRDAHDQAKDGKVIEKEDLKRGDLLFFAYEQGKGAVHHVAIYYGDGKMIHAPNTGKTVEIIELAGTIYEEEHCESRRYW